MPKINNWPKIIGGGMGVNISSPTLAREIAKNGGLGTVSGTAPEYVLVRELQKGDRGGDYRTALKHLPQGLKRAGRKIIKKYFVKGGIGVGKKYKPIPALGLNPSTELQELIVISTFALVWLAKRGHQGLIAINYLEKIQTGLIYSIVGAILAKVDAVVVGAGIPTQIAKVLDSITNKKTIEYKINVGGSEEKYPISFNPWRLFGKLPKMMRPAFLAIVSSQTAAWAVQKAGQVEGFIIESPEAGGHNAPPRRGSDYSEKEEKLEYVSWFREHNLLFWIGGGYASPERLRWALAQGAAGIQVGSAFALCNQSGMDPYFRELIRRLGYNDELQVNRTAVSPTGFPFMVVDLEDTLAIEALLVERTRRCNKCFLLSYYSVGGKVIARCPAEPATNWLRKGGGEGETNGKCCLCNALLAAAGLGDPGELPIFTLGMVFNFLKHLMRNANSGYGVADVFRYLYSTPPSIS